MLNRIKHHRRRSSGLVRTLVVASATLAALLVCFSMYQFSQMSTELPSRKDAQRLPSLTPEGALRDPSPPQNSSGVSVGQGRIGPSENMTLSIYPREGTQARMEIAVRRWLPREGSDREFLLTEPDIRLRTTQGNAVRVTAREGVLEAQRRGGANLEPQRGRLFGGVAIEMDRRSDEDKANLPEESQAQIDASDLVRIEMDEIEFDIEYSRILVPGPLRLSARDVTLSCADLELRFNEAQSRVESLRIGKGGRLELMEATAGLGVSLPDIQLGKEKKQSLADWIRTSLEASIPTASATATAESPTTSAKTDDVPVFRPESASPEPAKSIPYLARFEGDVDARQILGEATRSRLQSDSLEILRAFTESDTRTMKPKSKSQIGHGAPESTESAPRIGERVIVEWSQRLTLEAVEPAAAESKFPPATRLTAKGNPARLSYPEGAATCLTASYEPDANLFNLAGSEESPVTVRSLDQGSLTALSVRFQGNGQAMTIDAVGPGFVEGDLSVAQGADSAATGSVNRRIEFDRDLHAVGRVLRKIVPQFTGSVSTRDHRLLDSVKFLGPTRMFQDDTSLEANELEVTWKSRESWREVRQQIDQVLGRGNVRLGQGNDVLTCDDIDVEMGLTDDGRMVPRSAIARGAVVARQGEQTLRARDKLIADFDRLAAPGSPDDKGRVGVRRFRAYGEVEVDDPAQPLELSADSLDCTVAGGRELEKVFVVGREDRPASVRLGTFSVTGEEIRLSLPDEWAEVPGKGRMTLQSQKDLDGRTAAKPIPIAVTWDESMKYRGRENRAVFSGNVHAASESTTTFDAEELLIEFDDVAGAEPLRTGLTWGMWQPFVDKWQQPSGKKDPFARVKSMGKEPAYILASGRAIAMTSEVDPSTGQLLSRARLSGSKLSVNLRSTVSKMLIESPGDLQIEDFRPAKSPGESRPEKVGDLFESGGDAGPSKTLIKWRDLMAYDFSIEQTRFEGNVELKHFSGAELEKIFPTGASPGELPRGRATFLNCDVLNVDFLGRGGRSREAGDRRLGRLSSDRLRQFQAGGAVALRDQTEGLSLTADSVIYERERRILDIRGTRHRKASVVTQKPGKLPSQMAMERLFYNLATGQVELSHTNVRGQ